MVLRMTLGPANPIRAPGSASARTSFISEAPAFAAADDLQFRRDSVIGRIGDVSWGTTIPEAATPGLETKHA